MTSDDMDAVARIASEHPRLWIISDEIYSRLVYDQEAGSIAPSYLSAAERFGVRHRASVYFPYNLTRFGLSSFCVLTHTVCIVLERIKHFLFV